MNSAPCLFSVCSEDYDPENARAEKKGLMQYAHRFSRNYQPQYNPDARTLAHSLCNRVWSPSIFHDGVRKEANFKCSSVLGLDFDDTISLEEAISLFSDYRFIIGTTRSHTEGAHRFRVMLKLDRVITDPQDYRNIVKHYVSRFHSDPSCKDCARFYYPCTKIIKIGLGATLPTQISLNTDKQTARKEKAKKTLHRKKQGKKVLPLHIGRFLANGLVFSNGRNNSCFVTALELRKMGTSFEAALSLISLSPFDRTGFSDHEIFKTVRSAYKR